MRERKDEIYVGGYTGSSQLDTADSLAGEIGEDALDAGYSPPDYEPHSARDRSAGELSGAHESLEERLAEEEPDVSADDIDLTEQDPRAGRLVGDAVTTGADVGYAGWAATAEEAAMHVVDLDRDVEPD